MRCCHCGLKGHLQKFRAKKLGALGIVLMGLHILWHVVECLVLPAVLVALGGQAVADDAEAASGEVIIEAEAAIEETEASFCWLRPMLELTGESTLESNAEPTLELTDETTLETTDWSFREVPRPC